jgi:cyclopropane-fatty-acyl-phospholipid synthase
VRVLQPGFYAQVALRGSVGAGEAYAQGAWETTDLTAVVRLMCRNRGALDGLEGGLARLAAPLLKAWSWTRGNHRAGARRNIAAHYDLGNAFFECMLDQSMMYSAGIYASPSTSLHEASLAKLDRVAEKLALGPGDHLLEIGTGWGGLAIHCAANYGCRVTTTTISRAQHAYASERVRAMGLSDRVEVLLKDFRDLSGRYDKLVSIEMVEAIGWRQYPRYFKTISQLLATDGLALIQAITIQDQRYDAARRAVDFIQRHIFPGSTIPSVTALCQAMAQHSDLRLAHLEDLTPHYARTLRDWRENLARHQGQIARAGYDEHFMRAWNFYLCYCEGGFEERVIHDVQMLFAKPDDRRPPLLF